MGRFDGWTKEAFEKLSSERKQAVDIPEILLKMKEGKSDKSFYVDLIYEALKITGIEGAIKEFKFLNNRKFKFDIAIPKHKIAIEFEGGIFSRNKKSRHSTGAGYAKDAKKYNLAVMNGWKLLRYTPDLSRKLNWNFNIASEVKELIERAK